MDGRGYGSSYSSWGSGGLGSRDSGGFESYGGGYKDSMSGSGGFGGGSHMKRGISGGSPLSSGGTHADAVIAKINHRLDMLSQFEGGFKGPRGDGFDQYESFDSRTSALPSRDLYRSGGSSFGFGDVRGDSMLLNQQGGSTFGGGMGLGGGGGGFDSPSSAYGVAKMRQNMRESFASGQGGGSGGGGWVGANRRSPRRGGSAGGRGGFGGRRSDPTPLGGGLRGSGSGVQSHGGYSPGGGRGKLPSLLSNRMYPESGGFQGSAAGPHDFPGRHFGGGPRAGRQRGRKRPLNKQVKPQGNFQKKRKNPAEADEPESKMNRKEDEGTETTPEEPEKADDDKAETAADETQPTEGEDVAAPKQEEMTKPHGKQSQGQEKSKNRKRRGFLERVMFACSVCKFRSFYKADMEVHLESRFHKEHFKFLSSQLSKPTTDFLQEYLMNKFKKTDERVSQMENHSAAICQMYREQDLTRELGMEHFMRKVEAAHCSACDVFIPMQPHLIQKHIKSHDHNYNRKGMMEQSKRGCLSVARSILNHKLIGKKLESYLKGENPFVGNQDEQDPEDSIANEASEVTSEAAAGQTEVKDEPVPEEETVKEEMEEVQIEPPAATAADQEEEREGNMEQDGDKELENAEMEGFEVGEDEDEGYIVHNEFEEGGFRDPDEEEAGANVA
ncbi:A-kinase anchor protein 8-like isoform X3 [Oryzias latipes]|uniref:A-kinase anchor protein 8-like isoform X3 n=1 Tax=Oryzias latipes TaxID=8090 RepID=UPI0002A4C090|nr:A-kinase anchor protein 8-like isoform X3 [Oryzias latipes]